MTIPNIATFDHGTYQDLDQTQKSQKRPEIRLRKATEFRGQKVSLGETLILMDLKSSSIQEGVVALFLNQWSLRKNLPNQT